MEGGGKRGEKEGGGGEGEGERSTYYSKWFGSSGKFTACSWEEKWRRRKKEKKKKEKREKKKNPPYFSSFNHLVGILGSEGGEKRKEGEGKGEKERKSLLYIPSAVS